MRNLIAALLAPFCLATPACASDASLERALQAHISFLASDRLKGREAGSAEYEIAAEYVAARFHELGLKPAGHKGGFLQSVPLVSAALKDKGRIAQLDGKGEVALDADSEFVMTPSVTTPSLNLEAPLVFAGFGVVAPEHRRDDYKGLDVRGKIVVLLSGAPKAISGEERAHYGSVPTKMLLAEAKGAVGAIIVETPTRAKIRKFEDVARSWAEQRMVWRQPDGTGFVPGGTAPSLASISLKGAEKLFSPIKGGAAAIMAAAELPNAPLKGQPLGLTARISAETVIVSSQSSNVAGMIEGSDLAREIIILSGHLDHEGIGPEINGDTIYNGAMDNATGIASMIEVARQIQVSVQRPKRSILFLAVTAEEKGLVGADYFARHPTVPHGAMVANVNLDMPILTYAFEDVVAFGADRSTLGAITAAAAATMNVKVSPDAAPEQALFTRSDHYRFVQQGVPAVFLATGDAGPGKAAREAFLKDKYHKPGDETGLINWAAAAKFVHLNLAITRALADAADRPRWNKGDFFGKLYKGFGAE